MKIKVSTGDKEIKLLKFAALDGWDLQQRFIEFASSTDSAVRRRFTLDILSYARVIIGDNELPLSTDALIDNHLESWDNVKNVFEEVLKENGIDPSSHADRTSYWATAGAEMAIAFIAEASKLIGPALEIANENYKA